MPGYPPRPRRDVPYLLNSGEGPLSGSPLAFAHRGADPQRENTLGAFRAAVALGYRYLELDVRTARCGTLVVFHDATLDRVTTGTGRLSDHTWEELSQLRVGCDAGYEEGLLRFEDLLREWDDVRLNIDLKDAAAVPEFARLVNRYQAHERVLAASFEHSRLRKVQRQLDRPVAISTGQSATAALVLLGRIGLTRPVGRVLRDVACLQVPVQHAGIRIVTPGFIRRCHRAGLQVHVWLVNDARDMHHLLDLGVDGLMTDSATVLAEVMRSRGVWPQR
ncbi:MAG TPA: glycerophosphodiester phosphodiesterase [Candidatus Nesterenkonia stercoripullorum]|uniref:Glycerophosphodiester phosphodiesterase n=1 Tax=Candidatus Nesterenkonia stercoripullorum TaxID=2838701 RepID=A0A9D1UU81_9MICC|nr:glycerophosphodiester phosphodiesterase [Candidatus Nesterenkonia stercoripullorum]